ncbi:hypothetical protein QBC40DRAFT_341320 [Triangularia verruculosa]|uniref:Uncharacterized protein n=1 Tax=Triangularia verruculosa TaxID=2587418 RepID=A0AAN6XDP8_9PEZI|nr:hypothetical protein QBC40DRAFT_341320 [Triangularia verruculosa]
MPRQLPWAVKKENNPSVPIKAATTRSPAHPHRASRPSTATPNRESSRERTSNARGRDRSLSTSPPPEPPKEEFMIEGVDHDDKYRMVEDEFLSVAGEFTRHLHAAEYQRLKGLARSQNAETISNISRPVTGEMTDMVKRRHAALDKASKQRKAISGLKKLAPGAGNSDTDDEEPPEQTSLQGLMDSPRKRAVPLASFSSLLRGSSSLREPSPSRGRENAPGLARTESTFSVTFKREPTPDSDDLDSQAPWPLRRASTQPSIKREESVAQPLNLAALPATQPRARFRAATVEPTKPTSRPPERPPRQAPQASKSNDRAPKREDEDEDDEDEDDNDFLSRIRTRRAEQKRRREASLRTPQPGIKSESQEAALDEIPFI